MSGRTTVVVVEDEDDLRECLREVLEDAGYAVRTAADGREGLSRIAEAPRPCVVVLDLVMPVMSGNELWATMQADPALADVPVLVSTSDPARAPRGVRVLRKPYDVARILDAVAALSSSAARAAG